MKHAEIIADDMKLLGALKYYSKFSPSKQVNFAPLCTLLQSDVPFHWLKDLQAVFFQFEQSLTPIWTIPDA